MQHLHASSNNQINLIEIVHNDIIHVGMIKRSQKDCKTTSKVIHDKDRPNKNSTGKH